MQIDNCLVFLLNALLVVRLLGDLIHLHIERSEETALPALCFCCLLLLLCSDLFVECVVETEHFRELGGCGDLGIVRGGRQHLLCLLFGSRIILLVGLLALLQAGRFLSLSLQKLSGLLLLGLFLFYLAHGPIEDPLLV